MLNASMPLSMLALILGQHLGSTEAGVLGMRCGDDLYLKVRGALEGVVVSDFFSPHAARGAATGRQRIDRIGFAGGERWDQAMLLTGA